MANTTVFTVKGSGGVTVSRQDASTFIVDGAAIQGSSSSGFNPYYGTCTVVASRAAKTVSCNGFTLTTGAIISVLFTRGNTASGITLNVNGTGAKSVYCRGSAIANDIIRAQGVYTFVYTGSVYEMITPPIYTSAPAYVSHIYADSTSNLYDFVTRTRLSTSCSVNTVRTNWLHPYYGTGIGDETTDIVIGQDDDWTIALWVFFPPGFNNTGALKLIDLGSYSVWGSSSSGTVTITYPNFAVTTSGGNTGWEFYANIGAWTHFAMVNIEGTIHVYRNGTEYSSGGKEVTLYPNYTDLSINKIHIYDTSMYLGELIIAKEAIWTSRFNPNSTPL